MPLSHLHLSQGVEEEWQSMYNAMYREGQMRPSTSRESSAPGEVSPSEAARMKLR